MSKPQVIPELQNKNIISVVLGDYHNAALAANGKLYTWGAFSHGALGLGDPLSLPLGVPGGFKERNQLLRAQERGYGTPPDVTVPTEVRFDHGRKTPKDRFCFSVTAAGWHTGALVIDLEVCGSVFIFKCMCIEVGCLQPDKNEEEDEIELEPELEPRPRLDREHWQGPPILPLRGMPPIYRIGFTGRGMGRGYPGHRGGSPSA